MKKFHLHIDLPEEYAPLVKRGKAPCLSVDDCLRYRADRKTNLDLWTDGALYPKDPYSMQHPKFCSVTQLIYFVCHGKNGLLGYCERLEEYGNAFSMERIHCLEDVIRSISSDCNKKDNTLQIKLQENEFLQKEKEILQSNNELLQTIIVSTKNDIDQMKVELDNVRSSYSQLLKDVDLMVRKINSKKRKREICTDIHNLSSRGGYRKRRIRAFK